MKRPPASALSPAKPHGVFNAEKCVRYLRLIGVDIPDNVAEQWLDAQAAHRFSRSMKAKAAEGWDWWCTKGHRNYIESRRGRIRRDRVSGDRAKCLRCGAPLVGGRARWYRTRDGALLDRRPVAERWRPIDWQPADGPFESGEHSV
jgi:hypothetical protein